MGLLYISDIPSMYVFMGDFLKTINFYKKNCFAPLCVSFLYIKANMVSVCLSVWTKIGQCLEDSSSHCPFLVVTNKAGQGRARRPGQPLRGARRGLIIKIENT